MKCLICLQAETVNGLTSVTFERGEFRLLINNVPARVCPKCGETYVEENVALNLLRDAERESEQGTLDVVREYDAGLVL
jgi:YgiT-type zinc finger domain-containing protein